MVCGIQLLCALFCEYQLPFNFFIVFLYTTLGVYLGIDIYIIDITLPIVLLLGLYCECLKEISFGLTHIGLLILSNLLI